MGVIDIVFKGRPAIKRIAGVSYSRMENAL